MHFAGHFDSPSAVSHNVVIATSLTNGIISGSHGSKRRMVNLTRCAAHVALA
jgi:hypothetical protein